MSKNNLVFEFEVNAPTSLLYSYLTVPKSLRQWFADDVTENNEGIFNFKWDGEDHIAKMTLNKVNQLVRYDFVKDDGKSSFIEFRLEANELTQTSFIKITDSYMDESEQDATELWKNLIADLKDVIGA
ncbi:MAG TPA: START-like domain-containing protein [Cytophagaceae bacterium]|nr:START-like domain-containing protein [Cytophagaceae bacterium]